MSRATLLLALVLSGCTNPGAVADAGADLRSDRFCPLGDRACDPIIGCPDETGCNWCGCTTYATVTPYALCNLAGCARVHTECRSRADCTVNDDTCVFDPGCTGAPGRCTRPRACMSYGTGRPPPPGTRLEICGCDRQPRTVTVICGIEEPYRYIGTCR